MTVVESAEEAVGKYCNIKRAMKLIFAIPMKGEFADVNEALDSVLQGTQSRLCWFSTHLGGPLFCLWNCNNVLLIEALAFVLDAT